MKLYKTLEIIKMNNNGIMVKYIQISNIGLTDTNNKTSEELMILRKNVDDVNVKQKYRTV